MRLVWIGIVSLFAFPAIAFSCSCILSDGCPGLGNSKGPVFVGTVLAISDLPREKELQYLSSRSLRMRVDEQFGGIAAGAREIEVWTDLGGGDCGISAQVGDVYLIHAFVGRDGIPRAGICSGTRKIQYAGPSLRVLRQRRDGQRVPSLVGQIARQDRDFRDRERQKDAQPLVNTMVRVQTDIKSYETRSNTDGIFEFYDLPSGNFEFAPDLPPETKLSWYIGRDRPLLPFALIAGRCIEKDIGVFSSGSIQGRILDASGKPVPQASVYIIPAEEKALASSRELSWESQGKESFFKFVHIPPGNYILVVNPDGAQNSGFPYPRTFYPGVPDRESAGIITLRVGEQIKEADIHLPEPLATRSIKVSVAWADGRPVKEYVSIRAKPNANPANAAQVKSDFASGSAEVILHANEPYQIEARFPCRYWDGPTNALGVTLYSNSLDLLPGDPRKELRLTLSANACPEIEGKTRENGKP